jgi:uncharacterized protein involved in outer membrane biogenesis
VSRKKRLLLYIPCTIAGLAIASLLLFVFLLDLNNYKDYFEKKMEGALHRPVSIGSVESMLYKGLQIRFNDFRVAEQEGQPYYLKAEHLDIKIHLLSILKRRIFIKKIELEGPTLYVVRKPGVAVEAGGKSTAGLMKTVTSGASNMELLVKDFHVYEGKLVFLDETVDDGRGALEINDVNLLVQDLFWFTPPSLRLTGVISRSYDGGHESKLNIRLQFLKRPVEASLSEIPFSATVRLNSFNLSDYLPYFERLGFLRKVNALLDLDLGLSGSLAEGVTAEGAINFGDLRPPDRLCKPG